MFDLEREIADWRRQMLASGIKSPETLEELESHLRADFSGRLSLGVLETEAFHSAVLRLGRPDAVWNEFSKLTHPPRTFVTAASCLWAGLFLLMALALLRQLLSGRQGALLCAHIFSLTAGYGAVLLTGSLGVYCIWHRLFRPFTPGHSQWLQRAVIWSNRLSATLVAVGLLSGMLWARQNWGKYMRGDPREIGTLVALGWIIATLAVLHSCRVNDRITLPMSIGGNIIIALAWFGAGLLASHRGTRSLRFFWPLVFFMFVNLGFLGMGMMPGRTKAGSLERKEHYV